MHALLLAVLLAPAAEPDSPLVAAAKARRQAIRSIEFVCKVTEDLPPKYGESKGTTREWRFRHLRDGVRHRQELDLPPDGHTAPWKQIVSDDGTTVKHVDGPTTGNTAANTTCDIAAPGWSPIRLPFEVLDPITQTDRSVLLSAPNAIDQLSGFQPTGRTRDIDGVTATEWKDVKRGVQQWVDPARGSIVLRTAALYSGSDQPERQTDLWYSAHQPTGLWLPKAWDCERWYEDRTSKGRYRVTVEKLTVNADWPDAEFDQPFPVGTQVNDRVNGGVHDVQPDGTLRPHEYVPGELGPAWQNNDPPPPGWLYRNAWWLCLVLTIPLLGVLGFVLIRAFRRRPIPTHRRRSRDVDD